MVWEAFQNRTDQGVVINVNVIVISFLPLLLQKLLLSGLNAKASPGTGDIPENPPGTLVLDRSGWLPPDCYKGANAAVKSDLSSTGNKSGIAVVSAFNLKEYNMYCECHQLAYCSHYRI